MTRKSIVTTLSDSAGNYEQEIFTCDSPKAVIIGVHGNGVRRWDGKKFYCQVSEHFADCAVYLVDQNQQENGGCRLNSLDVMAARNQKIIEAAKNEYPEVPVWIIAHSMGCGIASMLDLSLVDGIIFIAPAVGNLIEKYKARYGEDIVDGKIVETTEGSYKNMPKEFMDSIVGVVWQDRYSEMLKNYSPIHVFESGADEIVDEERFELRDMPFASYTIIDGAVHNFYGQFSASLFEKIDTLI